MCDLRLGTHELLADGRGCVCGALVWTDEARAEALRDAQNEQIFRDGLAATRHVDARATAEIAALERLWGLG